MLLKLAKNRPSWTLTAYPGPAIGPFHWNSRRLSGRELAALQTFPQSFEVVGDVRAAHKQLGNAVPSAMAELLAHEIRNQFLAQTPCSGEDIKRLTLLPKRRGPPPSPTAPRPVALEYLEFVGDHPEHPGEGRGPGAQRSHE